MRPIDRSEQPAEAGEKPSVPACVWAHRSERVLWRNEAWENFGLPDQDLPGALDPTRARSATVRTWRLPEAPADEPCSLLIGLPEDQTPEALAKFLHDISTPLTVVLSKIGRCLRFSEAWSEPRAERDSLFEDLKKIEAGAEHIRRLLVQARRDIQDGSRGGRRDGPPDSSL